MLLIDGPVEHLRDRFRVLHEAVGARKIKLVQLFLPQAPRAEHTCLETARRPALVRREPLGRAEEVLHVWRKPFPIDGRASEEFRKVGLHSAPLLTPDHIRLQG